MSLFPIPPAVSSPIAGLVSQARRFRTIAAVAAVAVVGQLAAGAVTVRAGDTLYSLAREHGTSVAALADVNDLDDRNHIEIGQRLVLPGTTPAAAPAGQRYQVKAGDSLYGIARRFDVAVGALAHANNLTDRNVIRVGQWLRIPSLSEITGATPPNAVTPPTNANPTPPRTGVTTIYAVRAGDTLTSIARRFGTSVATIMQQNRLTTTNLRIGQYLVVAT